VRSHFINTQLLSAAGIRLILALFFIYMLLLGLVSFAVPLYSLELGASQVVLGVIVGAFRLSGILLSIPSSVLSNRSGRRMMILISFFLCAAGGTLDWLARSCLWLIAGQILIGLADVFFTVSGMTYLSELSPEGKQGEVQGLGFGIMGLGSITGSVLGGYMIRSMGFQPTFLFVILLGSLGFALSCRLQKTRPSVTQQKRLFEEILSAHRGALELIRHNAAVLLAILVTLSGTIGWMSIGSTFYLEYVHHLGFPPDIIGLLNALRTGAGTLSRFSFAAVSNGIGVISAALSGIAVGGLTLAMTPFLSSFLLLATVGFLGAIADGLWMPGVFTIVADSTDRDQRALAVALVNIAWAFAGTVTPPILGRIAERTALSATFWVAGPLSIVLAILLYIWKRKAVSSEFI